MPRRNITGLVLVATLALAKADSAAVGVVAPVLRVQLHLDDAELGLLASLGSVTGAICALPAGGLVDRRHRPVVVATALAVWSLALGAAGLATSFAVLAAARLASGAVASVARPAAVSLLGDSYAPARRGRAMAALDAGQSAGAALCFLVGAIALHFLTWRWTFWLLAGAGLVVAFGALHMAEPMPQRHPDRPTSSVLADLVRIRTNLIVVAADAVGTFFYAGVTSFAVLFVTERYGLAASLVDGLAPLVGLAVIGGLLAGGRIGDRLVRDGAGRRRLVLACVLDLGAVVLLGAALATSSLPGAVVLLSLAATVLAASGPCLDAVRVDVVPPAMWGRAEAARGLATLVAAAVGPVTFGTIAMWLGGHGGGGRGLRDAFAIMLVPLACSGLVLLYGVRHYDGDAAVARTRPAPSPGAAQAPGLDEGIGRSL